MPVSRSSDQPEPDDRGFRVRDRRWWAEEQQGEDAPQPGEGQAAAPPTYIAQLEGQLEEYRGEIASLKGRVSAGLDEVERIKARIQREADRELERQRRQLVAGFLEVLDDLDRAIDGARAGGASEAVLGGLDLVRRRFLAKLAEHGVQRIEAHGVRFDPQIHEAVAVVEPGDPAEVGTIVEVVSPGYAIGDEILRAPKVVVARSAAS